METAPNPQGKRSPGAVRQPTQRSAVTNGRRMFVEVMCSPDIKAEAQAGLPVVLKVRTARLGRAILPIGRFRNSAVITPAGWQIPSSGRRAQSRPNS
jgi:hypothetical protein